MALPIISDYVGTVVKTDVGDVLFKEHAYSNQRCELCGTSAEDTLIYVTTLEDDRSTFTQCHECSEINMGAAIAGESSDVWLVPAAQITKVIG